MAFSIIVENYLACEGGTKTIVVQQSSLKAHFIASKYSDYLMSAYPAQFFHSHKIFV